VESIDYRSLADQVYVKVKRAILEGRLAPGQRLSASELAKELKVSRTPVRDALQRLATEGLVDIQRGIGVYVTTLSVKDIEELYAIRSALEGLACSRACERMSHTTKQELAGLLAQAEAEKETAASHVDEAAEVAHEFHERIIEEADSPLLTTMLSELKGQIDRFRRANMVAPTRRQAAFREHRQILEAMDNGDSARARELMESHILMAWHCICERLEIGCETEEKNTESPEAETGEGLRQTVEEGFVG